MCHHQALNPEVLRHIADKLTNQTVLDVGCGFGEWGFLLRTRKQDHPYLIGLDVWRPFIEKIEPLEIYDELIQTKVPPLPLKAQSVDISLACEILEHLPKHEGWMLLTELERVTNGTILVSCPMHIPQGEALGCPYSKHISEWAPQDLADRKYKVKLIELVPPRTLRLFDRIRRLVFKLPPPPKLIVAWKQQ